MTLVVYNISSQSFNRVQRVPHNKYMNWKLGYHNIIKEKHIIKNSHLGYKSLRRMD